MMLLNIYRGNISSHFIETFHLTFRWLNSLQNNAYKYIIMLVSKNKYIELKNKS